MPAHIFSSAGAAFFTGTVTSPLQDVFTQPGAIPQHAGYALNNRKATLDHWKNVPDVAANISPAPAPAGKPQGNYLAASHHCDFHYRIWVIPKELSLRNPSLGTAFPIKVWNTFPSPATNLYNSTALQDLTGVVADIAPGTPVRSFTYPTVNISLTGDAGFKMNGLVRFIFTQGEGQLRLIVERASVVPVIPDSPVRETWNWKTQVMTSENGTEQRIALLPAPRKKTDFELTVIYPDEANSVIKQLFGDAASAIVLPQYQYLAGIKVPAPLGSTFITADVQRGDLRVGSAVLLVDRKGVSEINSVKAITEPSTIELDNPLASSFDKGSWIIPAFATYLQRRVEFERAPADGYARLSTVATDADVQTPFLRPNSRVSLPTFNGLPNVIQRPVVPSRTVSATYDSGTETLDFGRKITIVSPWDHSQIELQRAYYVDRFFEPKEMDYWRSFLEYCKGMQKPFYTSTYRPDLKLFTAPDEQSNTLRLDDSRYSTVFFGKKIADQIAIYTEGGVHYTSVNTATADENDRDTLNLVTSLPAGPEWTKIERISFLLRCRLASDQVEWEHYPLHSFLKFPIRTTDD